MPKQARVYKNNLLERTLRLLNRWVVRAGKEHPDLATLSLALLDGSEEGDYKTVMVDDQGNVIDPNASSEIPKFSNASIAEAGNGSSSKTKR
jgi:hypothetical protein